MQGRTLRPELKYRTKHFPQQIGWVISNFIAPTRTVITILKNFVNPRKKERKKERNILLSIPVFEMRGGSGASPP